MNKIPKLHPFIVKRKEYFGGYIFNPYLLDHMSMNEIGFRIIELCDGSRTVAEIVAQIFNEFDIPIKSLEPIVIDALNEFNKYFAINWREKKDTINKYEEDVTNSHIFKEYLSAPLSVLWDITYNCNLNCEHCLASAGEPLEDELTLEEVKDIIDQLSEMKVFHISFLGGEPLLRNDFFDILEYASKFNFGITFSTNGTLIDDEVIKILEELKVFTVQVSLDGLEDTHNKIRGSDASYRLAIKAIEMLVDSGIRVGISVVANKLNLKEIESLIQLSISLGAISFKSIPLMPVGRGKESKHLSLNNKEMKNYVESMLNLKKKYKDKIHIFAEETYSWLFEEPVEYSSVHLPFKGVPCTAGNSQIVISPDGLVFPCPFLHELIAGNLRKESLQEIWHNSDILNFFRELEYKELKGKCKDCPYTPIHCRGGCRAAAYANSGDLLAEDPICWYKH